MPSGSTQCELRLGVCWYNSIPLLKSRDAESYRLSDALSAAGRAQTAQVERLRQQRPSTQEQEITWLDVLCLAILTRQYWLNFPGGHGDDKNSARSRVRRYQNVLAIRQEARPAIIRLILFRIWEP